MRHDVQGKLKIGRSLRYARDWEKLWLLIVEVRVRWHSAAIFIGAVVFAIVCRNRDWRHYISIHDEHDLASQRRRVVRWWSMSVVLGYRVSVVLLSISLVAVGRNT